MSQDSAKPQRGHIHVPAHKAGAQERPRWFQVVTEIVIVLVLALLVSILLRQFVVQVYSIPSRSMENTLDVGDRIAVNRIPVTGKDIKRGDVVVFADDKGWLPEGLAESGSFFDQIGRFMGLLSSNGEEVLVKRVIGVGGDTVSCCNAEGKLEVNGVPIDETYLPAGMAPSAQEFSVTVPEGKYWVMGDNRSGSADSRAHYFKNEDAFVDRESMIGRVWSVVWPINHWSIVSHREAFAGVS